VLVLERLDVLPSLSQVPVIPISTQIRGLLWEVLLGPEDGLPSACLLKPEWIRIVERHSIKQLSDQEQYAFDALQARTSLRNQAIAVATLVATTVRNAPVLSGSRRHQSHRKVLDRISTALHASGAPSHDECAAEQCC
jgi:hypothetical protein